MVVSFFKWNVHAEAGDGICFYAVQIFVFWCLRIVKTEIRNVLVACCVKMSSP